MKDCKLALQKAFLDLLKEKPFDKISIKEITARANVSRTSYYRHYYTQLDLLNKIIDSFFDKLHAIQKHNDVRSAADPESDRRFSALMYQTILCYYDSAEMLKTIIQSDMKHLLLKRIYEHIYPASVTWLHSTFNFSDGYAQSVTFVGFISFYSSGYVKLMCDWISDGCRNTPEQMLDLLLKLSGVAAMYVNSTM